jgi:adenosylcobinamide-GDP ribazoletransferase
VARSSPYARPGGLATAMLDSDPPRGSGTRRRVVGVLVPGVVGVVLAVAMAVVGRGTHGLAAVGAEAVAMALVVVLAQRRIGGFTGDVLGAAGVVGETVGLLVLAAKW